jgi:hypothetical protein
MNIHRDPNAQWVIISESPDDDEFGVHYVCKGNGFRYYIVATSNTYAEAEEMAIAMNYWETRPQLEDEAPQ